MLCPGAAGSCQRTPRHSRVPGRWLAFIRYWPVGRAGASRLIGMPSSSAMRLKTLTDAPGANRRPHKSAPVAGPGFRRCRLAGRFVIALGSAAHAAAAGS